MTLLEVKNLKKIYTTRFGGNQVQALSNVNFSVEEKEYVAIMGESGSGKTTLLNILAALDKPTSGKVYLKGRDLGEIRNKEMAAFRRQNLGFVFQDFNLLDTFSLEDNIYLPMVLSGKKYPEMSQKLKPIAQQLGITQLLKKFPYEVSGGQKQRAAVARALGPAPKVLLCDEATSALDPQTTQSILALLKEINQKLGITILLITHEMGVVKSICDSVALLDQGSIIEQGEVGWFFAHAKAPLAREFIRSSLHLEIPAPYRERLHKTASDGQIPLLRLGFSGNTIDTPAISHASRQFGIDVNILSASIEQIGHSRFGFLLVELQGDESAQQATIAYLQQQQIDVEVLGYVHQHA